VLPSPKLGADLGLVDLVADGDGAASTLALSKRNSSPPFDANAATCADSVIFRRTATPRPGA
jgi:hypothetical protein